jgi:hypothetical protein
MERAFVIRPFGKKKAKQKKDATTECEIDFDAIHRALIGPALTAVGLDGGTTVDISRNGERDFHFPPSGVVPMMTSRHWASSSSRACTWKPSAQK